MGDREKLEGQIRDILAAKIDAVTFSNKLFHQGIGLFPRLGSTLEDRRAVAQTDLFREAMKKLRELERQEIEERQRPSNQTEPATAL